MDQWFAIATAVLTQPRIFGEIYFALGHANRRARLSDLIHLQLDAGTIPQPNSHRFAYTTANTHSYPQHPYATTKSSAYASASPASTPPSIVTVDLLDSAF